MASVVFSRQSRSPVSYFSIEPVVEYYFPQNYPAMFELTTRGYMLLNLFAMARVNISRKEYTFSLSGKNLLNNAYASHLSRIRYYGLLNQGINIIFSVSTDFDNR
jgi:outer membrane receptor protein involved in Fe transport